MIAYDTSFNPKKHLLHTKTNENIPTIRLVTKNTLEHALNYQMIQKQDNFLFSDLSLFEMKRILTFGLWKRNQCVEVGCELSKFDIQGTCNKVFQWIDEGMSGNLTFGMEDAVRLRTGFGKERKELASVRAEKRVSDFGDEGSLKKRKVSKMLRKKNI